MRADLNRLYEPGGRFRQQIYKGRSSLNRSQSIAIFSKLKKPTKSV